MTVRPADEDVEAVRELLEKATPGGGWEFVYEADDSYGSEIIMVKDESGAQIQYTERCYDADTEVAISRLVALAPTLAAQVLSLSALLSAAVEGLGAAEQRAADAEKENAKWLAWSGGQYPDDSVGDVIAAYEDGTIVLDDAITTWNPLRALAFFSDRYQTAESPHNKERPRDVGAPGAAT